MELFNKFFAISLLLALAQAQSEEDRIVDAGLLGRIRGDTGLSAIDLEYGSRREYIQFRGIPYATIPDRFLPSRILEAPLTQDDSIFNATSTPFSCFQPLLPPFMMTEDCLTINIYTHKVHINCLFTYIE